jgi:uncharacterized membrane protein YphA (DoxX/SURF4 family)
MGVHFGILGIKATRDPLVRELPLLGRAMASVCGAVLLTAGCSKALNVGGLAQVPAFDGFPAYMYAPILYAIVLSELTMGTLLLLNLAGRRTLVAAASLLAIFTLQLGYLLLFEDAPSCSCFGKLQAFEAARVHASLGVIRNGCLLIGLAGVYAMLRQSSVGNQESTF